VVSKTVSSREEAEARREKAADFMRRIGNDEAADDFANMTTQQYIEHAGLQVANPRNRNRRNCYMPANGQTKADLQEILDSVEELLDNVYQPETSREDAMAAIGDALDAISGEAEEEDEDDIDDANGD
jgi:hypothetical protein